MNGLNAMIAQGYQPTADMATAKRGALGNALLEQQLQVQPQMMQIREQEMQLKQLALDIKARALESGGTGGNVSLEYPFGTIEGPQEAIAMAADMMAKYPAQAADPGFMPWLAKQGISIKKKEPETPKEPKILDVETWVTPSGQTMNLRKGDMPPAGSVPYKGKGMEVQFDPETGRPISISTGGPSSTPKPKIMPAGEASQVGEFAAYMETMDSIDSLMKDIKVSGEEGGKTGPGEIYRKYIDNWEIFPNEKRIELRTLVARLPGLMYAMRGKQLSDKELQVAMNMMPRMELGPTAFAISYKNFNEYLHSVMKGKEKAMGAAGYKVEGVFPKNVGRFNIEEVK